MNLKLTEKINIILTHIVLPFFAFVAIACIVAVFEKVFSVKMNSLFTQTISNIMFLLVMTPFFFVLRKKYELKYAKIEIKSLKYMVPLAFGLSISLNIIIGYFIPDIDKNEVSISLLEISEKFSIFLSIFIVGVITPMTEELLFRGYIYDGIRLISNNYIAVILSAIIFSITHGNIEQGIYALIVGLFFGYIIEKYHNIIYTVVLHCCMNSIVAIFQKDIGNVSDFRIEMFLLFITLAIFVLTIFRINIKK